MPGYSKKQLGTGSYEWMYNTRGIRDGVTGMLDVSAFTAATHFPNGYFPSGLPVKINSLGAVVPWTDAAGNKLGYVGGDWPTDGVTDFPVHIITHPEAVKIDKLPVPFTVPTTASVPHINFISGV